MHTGSSNGRNVSLHHPTK
uniref:Uncharacterized protein n=1 Tax=Arundo donax TaxID=35708 RepID=A0A0A9GR84_ARUDO